VTTATKYSTLLHALHLHHLLDMEGSLESVLFSFSIVIQRSLFPCGSMYIYSSI